MSLVRFALGLKTGVLTAGWAISLVVLSGLLAAQATTPLPVVQGVAGQPAKAQIRRLAQALQSLGQPLSPAELQALDVAYQLGDDDQATRALQAVLDPHVLAQININPESRVKVTRGSAAAQLMQNGWRVFLVKVHNEAGVTAPLRANSPQAATIHRVSTGKPDPEPTITPRDLEDRWLQLATYDQPPLTPTLSGLALEYRLVQCYARDVGPREATLQFDVGQGTQDVGFRSELPVLFDCQKSVPVTLHVLDVDGAPTLAQFVIRDPQGRVYPARGRRLEPDFFFHDQIYRNHGETVWLPPGEYEVSYSRGPEYVIQKRQIQVPQADAHQEQFQLKRWIHLAKMNWYSGDHHVHAAGCSHYDAPTHGVTPTAMMRHVLGEDLNVGCVLSWGPCWYTQKQYFQGKTHELSQKQHLMRYDVEVSGFPSSHCGHLCLLNLSEDDYPGTTKIEEWPSWDLPVLQWGQKQGGVVGFSHSGWGLEVDDDQVPSFKMPKFDGIGANEFVVDVVHQACDFISAVDTPSVWELSIWYHALNCGFTTRISGETDFPCIYDERVGLGRVYVKLPADQPLTYEAWIEGVRDGRSYCGDGLSHLIDFEVNGHAVGSRDGDQPASHLRLTKPETVHVTLRAAALLEEKPREDIRRLKLKSQPYWHVERARVADSRRVPIELIVNGKVAQRQEIVADGSIHDLAFDVKLDQSSWVAVRILPSCHTNPVFVLVGDQPIRGDKRSAEWCREAVDVCWEQKRSKIRDADLPAAAAAFEKARAVYDAILADFR